jgi:hypothetical protein
VLDKLLAKDEQIHYAEENKIVFTPFPVDPEDTRVRVLRQRVLHLVMDCTNHQDPKVIFRAVESLALALARPGINTGINFSEKELQAWENEQEEVLLLFNDLVQKTTQPIIHLQLWNLLIKSSHYQFSDRLRSKALQIVSKIPDTFDLRMLKSLIHTRWLDRCLKDEEKESKAVHLQSIDRHWYHAIAQEFQIQYPDASEAFHILNRFLELLHTYGYDIYPAFLSVLSQQAPLYITPMIDVLLEKPVYSLTNYFAFLIQGVRITYRDRFIAIAQRVIANGNNLLCNSLVRTYCWDTSGENIYQEDIEVLQYLLHHSNTQVQSFTISALQSVYRNYPRVAINLALSIEFGDNQLLAHEFFMIFDASLGIHPDALKDEDVDDLVTKILFLNKIEDYHIRTFLNYAVERRPYIVLHLLFDRIAYLKQHKRKNYYPLPYPNDVNELELESFGNLHNYQQIVRFVRDYVLEQPASTWLNILFRIVSLHFCQESLDVLSEWVQTQDQEKIKTVGALLSYAPQDFVFTHTDYVVNLIEQAYKSDCYENVRECLFLSAIPHSFKCEPGKPAHEHIMLRDQAEKIVSKLSPISPAYNFYNQLIQYAEQAIQTDLADKWCLSDML